MGDFFVAAILYKYAADFHFAFKKLFSDTMSFGGGGFSGSKRTGLKVISGSHGQVLRFHEGKGSVIGSGDFTVDSDTGYVGLTGSLNIKGDVCHSGTISPENGTDTLGTETHKYANVHATEINTDNVSAANLYTGDLHMKNERGDWTIYEEKNSLIAQNNLTGERFKLAMEKIED